MDHIDHMLDIGSTLILASDSNFLCITQIVLRYTADFLAHCRREKKRVPFLGNIRKDGIDAFRESHVQHLVRLIKHDILNCGKRYGLALHQVNKTARSGHNDVHATLQSPYLAFN